MAGKDLAEILNAEIAFQNGGGKIAHHAQERHRHTANQDDCGAERIQRRIRKAVINDERDRV